jgi:glycerol kinase
MAEHVLALDLGTTGVRALVVGAGGAVRARVWRPLAARFPRAGWFEQDPAAYWSESEAVARAALSEAALGARDLAAIGVVTQRATALAWDARSGAPLGPALGWQDQRTGPRVRELNARGIPVTTLPSATKFEWLLRQEPAVAAAARSGRLRLGTPDVWLTDRLTGGARFATDASQASCTGLFDLRAGAWSAPALDLFGIDAAWLPALIATNAIAGETPRGWLGAPVPVAARAGDQQAASFAQGALAPGAAKLTLGTSAMLDLHTGDRVARAPRGSHALALWELDSGARAFCLEGTVITAGAAIDWLVDLGLLARASDLDAAAARAPDADGVVCVPALQGLGTPLLDDRAHAILLGVTRGTRAEHIVRAVIEGVAQRCADVCETLAPPPGPLRVDGGLARSDAFLAALADALGREIWRAAETETTALGAAYLAGLATGVWHSAEEAVATAAPPRRVAPQIGDDERSGQRSRWRRAIERARSDPPR